MKKFLLILLIAVAASVSVEFDGTELNGWLKDIWGKFWGWLKKLPELVRKAIQWLKDHGWWDPIIDLIEKYGAPKAIELCKAKVPSPFNNFCEAAINKIIEWLRK